MQFLVRTTKFGGSFFISTQRKSELPVLVLSIYTSPSIYIFFLCKKRNKKRKVHCPFKRNLATRISFVFAKKIKKEDLKWQK